MNTHFVLATGLIAGSFLVPLAPAQAHGSVQWSVTIGTPVYRTYPSYPPPGVVVYPQSQYIYGAPPSAFAPPPVTYYYVQPQPVYRVSPPPVLHYGYRALQHGHPRHHGWHGGGRWDGRHDGRHR